MELLRVKRLIPEWRGLVSGRAPYEEAIISFNMMHEIGSLLTVVTYNSLVFMFARGWLFKQAEAMLMKNGTTGDPEE